jgi:hypothetical protein
MDFVAVQRIPQNLDEAIVTLTAALDEKEKAEFVEHGPNQYHSTLGRYLRNTWGLWHGSVLAKWFEALGIYHADDMSGIVLESLWRSLTGKPIDLDGQIEKYLEYWKRLGVGPNSPSEGL